MGSRKEEERNEKIIRGLLKLPPNRRCMNCNGLGPQYVCTNFWTFVCQTCSGIHREFTHRVKSVSMAKFTSKEVQALQNGGNQRAREMYLENWDPQRQRLFDSSNVGKVREFIKTVYVDRKYARDVSEKLPGDIKSSGGHQDEIRRASSYHSYSQSPPYENQYEERRYGKKAAELAWKPGSDRALNVRKVSSFFYSPGRCNDLMSEDRFSNDGGGSVTSDISMSSGGDIFMSAIGSPSFGKEDGLSSPAFHTSKDTASQNVPHQTKNLFADAVPPPQRTTSLIGFKSFDSNSESLKSYNSASFVDLSSEAEQTGTTLQNNVPPSSSYGGLDLFEAQVPKPVSTKASTVDLFDLTRSSSAPSIAVYKPSTVVSPTQYFSPAVDFFAEIAVQQPAIRPSEFSIEDDKGWATFDSAQPAAGTVVNPSVVMPSGGDLSAEFKHISPSIESMHWPAYQNYTTDELAPSISSPWDQGLPYNVPASVETTTQLWNAFEDHIHDPSFVDTRTFSEPPGAANSYSSVADQHLGIPANIVTSPTYNSPMHSNACDRRSTNPFDLPYDSDLEQSNMFMDMNALQTALPDVQSPPAFQPWFPQNPATQFIQPGTQGSLPYMAGQSPSSQLQNLSSPEPVAYTGGNPFA